MLVSKLCILYLTIKTSLSREGYDTTIKSLEEVEIRAFQNCLELNFQIVAQRTFLLLVWGKSVPFCLCARHIWDFPGKSISGLLRFFTLVECTVWRRQNTIQKNNTAVHWKINCKKRLNYEKERLFTLEPFKMNLSSWRSTC